ncbi:Acyl_transf_3 domain-containing protein [Caenorhabditis elegans]|uniref:Acyl_transf_3 domain-containing protein n=1 Tax=Caenorhabditis elegans TaxID=6239 RepID=G5EGR2_CAEEL|nr:Acyl_transf_3 domain-containing protein [Caenorhabditis elegans]NP_493098.1 Acyl_transf_3 domain-containing protein [Caenorhabditis elegans]CAB04376.2 Acyl_transf_3 domain-containing protein [Caenorhabditis elegans]CAB04381.2 Acyl_transf_3 domain-containing protein [Caenorhabditis elegans]|eukprot:NP_493094.1 O-ACyltransferase homolog [Caenorhabditis elegans]
MSEASKPKRLDLQGLRGLAILAVLGFHFYPAQFPNGYLGVDQFFVLSGFLMCMLLKRAESDSTCTLITLFYSKRFKRILPLYLLIILLSMISLYTIFPDTSIETNQKSATRAMLFVSNAPTSAQDNYFSMLTKAIDIFTHTWSLSVEAQFYCLVPFIFLIATRLSAKLQLAYYAILGLCSYAFFCFTPDNTSFNSVFARIWQFLIGMIVFQLGILNRSEVEGDVEEYKLIVDKEENIPDAEKSHSVNYVSYLPLFSIIFINALPYTLSTDFVRPFVTLVTGFLMMISENNMLLSNKGLAYIGNISYSLYLIHWPVYAYWKLTCEGDQNLLIIALLSSIVLAVIVHEFFEKWYLKLCSTSIGLVTVLLILLNVFLINKEHFKMGPKEKEEVEKNVALNYDDAILKNHQWDLNDQQSICVSYCNYEAYAPLGWCNHTSLSPSGKYKISVIGNSWAANHGAMVHEECGSKANTILQGSMASCEVLYPSLVKGMVCQDYVDDFQKRMKAENPDYLFIITRYISVGEPFPANITSFDLDPIYQTMKNLLFGLLASTKLKIYILDAIPRHNVNNTKFIAEWVKEGVNLVEIDKRLGLMEDQLTDGASYEMARRRYAALVKDCDGRCVLVDYKPVFYNSTIKSYRIFDNSGYSYLTTPKHLTPRGLEHVRHVWKDVCATL